MKIVILDAGTIGDDIDFSPITSVSETKIYKTTENCLIEERISDADIVIINKTVLSRAVLEKAKKLKLICLFAIGFNNVDIEYCRQNNIKVRNIPGYCVESVCQHTFALLFSLIENIRYYDDFVKTGKYSAGKIANHIGKPFEEISGKKWGIIGMGAIGRSVAHVATAFGANVSYCSISGAKRHEEYPLVSFDEIISESDIISVHCPLNEKTLNLIGKAELLKMKNSAVLINVGRGAVIDEAALAEAIKNKTISGAGIDVYSEEPPQEETPLMALKNNENIIFTPHIAWASLQARKRCISMTADNIKAFLEGKPLHDVWK